MQRWRRLTRNSARRARSFARIGIGAANPRLFLWALGVLGLIQFMLILDVTVVNVALPDIQTDLDFTESGLAWVVNGYVLMAGGLLLLGGRLADMVGRKRVFLGGVLLFSIASAACGAAVNAEMLVGARFLQGIGEALAAPASLGLGAQPGPSHSTPASCARAAPGPAAGSALGSVLGSRPPGSASLSP